VQVFNILGPLINPAQPRGIVAGVATPGLGRLVCETFRLQGMESALVLCGAEGLDEVRVRHTDPGKTERERVIERSAQRKRMGTAAASD
jgi:anthranilate phosphoribosyltransferase